MSIQHNANKLYIGLLSGTSVDGVDAGLFEFADNASGTQAKLLQSYQHPYPAEIREDILWISQPGENEIDRMGSLDIALGQIFAQAALNLIEESNINPQNVCAIGSHGQTIRHRPRHSLPFSLQIGDPNTIAHRTGISTVADLRRKDMAAGGQGAPLAPAFHQAAFYSSAEKRCVINIGGIANISILNKNNADVEGYDTGPGNILMDSWVNTHLRQPYDEDGVWAKSGNISEVLIQHLMRHPYFAQPQPKSTGREDFNRAWLDQTLSECETLSAQDVQASLCELTALSISQAVSQHDIDVIYLCGGGTNNLQLVERLKSLLSGIRIDTTQTLGIAPDWVESGLFAWLAKQRMENLAGNLPRVTGANKAVILGGIYAP